MPAPKLHSHGRCPLCLRTGLLLNDDNTVARAHKDGLGYWCLGKDMEGEPCPPASSVSVGRIRVRQSRHSGRWRVEVGGRLEELCDDYGSAWELADGIAGRQREASEALVAELNRERFGRTA